MWNKLQIRSMLEPMNGYEAMVTIVHDSFMEVLSIVCAGCLSWCLTTTLQQTTPGHDFTTTLPYRIAVMCIPMIGSLYCNYKTKKTEAAETTTFFGGCLNDESLLLLQQEEEAMLSLSSSDSGSSTTTTTTNYEHSFPIIFIFFTIVTLSLAFMKYQSKQQQDHIDKVTKLRNELHTTPQKKTTTTTQNKELKNKK